jgi:hypothetical protein
MMDWFIALTPLLLVPLVFLLLFVGCGLDVVGTGPPAPPPAPPGGPGGGSGGGPGGGPPPPPPGGGGPPPPPISVAATRFQLNLAPDLQAPMFPQVWTVDVQWTFKKAGAVLGNFPPTPLRFAPKDPARKNLEYGVDDWSQHVDANDADVGSADAVACTCTLTFDDGSTSIVTSAAPDAPMVKHACELYMLSGQAPGGPGMPRKYIVGPETPNGC